MFNAGVSSQPGSSDDSKPVGDTPSITPPVSPATSQNTPVAPLTPPTPPPMPNIPPQPAAETAPPILSEEPKDVTTPALPKVETPEPLTAPPQAPKPVDKDPGLVALKQKALGELSPLVDKLDQQPQERFRTIMMLMQATDDSNLVDKAYQAAQAIGDEKERAQALLDIVNEINYFTQIIDNESKS